MHAPFPSHAPCLLDSALILDRTHSKRTGDYLTINGTPYQGYENRPLNLRLEPGDIIEWRSDESQERGGFTICGISS